MSGSFVRLCKALCIAFEVVNGAVGGNLDARQAVTIIERIIATDMQVNSRIKTSLMQKQR